MHVEPLESDLTGAAGDLVAIALFEGATPPEAVSSLPGATDADGKHGSVVILRRDSGPRIALIGAGPARSFDPEGARVFAARAEQTLREVRGDHLSIEVPAVPDPGPDELASALVEGAILSSFRLDRFRTETEGEPAPPKLDRLDLLSTDPAGISPAVETARIAAGAENRARELQALPANVVTPEYLAERAREIAGRFETVEVEVLDREAIAAAGMGGLESVARGSTAVEPRLITLRYEGRGEGEVLGLVGKSVTFDSGGISIKPSAGMHEMKMDMSGGAAVLEAVAAVAELGIETDLVAVLPATENLPSGSALKPGDVITQLNGKTVEVTNTDAEGRLILADALVHCARQGADRMVDIATLTGAVVIGLGSTYAALISDDDTLADQVTEAGRISGEMVWRLPLHEEYFELTKGELTDLVNASPKRKAGTIYAGSFLEQFTEGRPWAHLDIAGVSWDTGRAYWGSGPTGFGTRLLIDLVRSVAAGHP